MATNSDDDIVLSVDETGGIFLMKRVVFAALMSAVCASGAAAQEDKKEKWMDYDTDGKYAGSYLCIADAAGGVKYYEDTEKWDSARFNVDGIRRIVRVSSNQIDEIYRSGERIIALSYNVKVSEFGSSSEYNCINQQSLMNKHYINGYEILTCSYVADDFSMDFETLRYMKIFRLGYVAGIDNRTPNIEIGKCSKI